MVHRFWILIGQDFSRPIGGIKQIFRLAEALISLGYDCQIVQGTSDFFPSWFNSSTPLSFCSFQSFKNLTFSSYDVLILPEVYSPQFFKFPGLKKIIFNQNYGYTFGEKLNITPDFIASVYSSKELVRVLCVSSADYLFLENCLSVDSGRLFKLINPIEDELFYPSFPKKRIIAFMPRKNPTHGRLVTSLLSKQSWFLANSWQIQPLDNLSLEQIASHLRESFIFLSFGCPEGFGLPMAEALASGCHLVGYDGVGGRELFAITEQFQASHNVPYYDFSCFISTVERVAALYDPSLVHEYDHSLMLDSSELVRNRYSFNSFVKSVERAFSEFD